MCTLRPGTAALIAVLVAGIAQAGPVEDVLATDAAFAARAAEAGQHLAFAEYLAPDGIVFRPEAVAGQQWFANNEPATGRLEWWPAAAAVDCSGRLAVSTGPWRYTNAAGGDAVAGHYLSVWRLEDDGRWLVVLDHGIDHPPAAVPAAPLQAALARLWPAAGSGSCAGGDAPERLARAERDFDRRVERDGLQEALRRQSVPGALAFRDDTAPGPLAPVAGDARFAAGSAAVAGAVTGGAITVPGGDMAVTHGEYRSADGANRALYIRVWQRDRRDWGVGIDLLTPLPPIRDP